MKKGFTLIEMSIVLVIIGVLAGVLLRNIGSQTTQARDARRISELRNLSIYLVQYLTKRGDFPSSADSSPNWTNLQSAFNSAGLFVTLPKPPAGAPYEYFPCSDDGGTTWNHFILRTKLEQGYTQAPAVYEGSYNSASIPSGWTCSPSTIDCQASSKYYCVVQ